MKLFGHAIIIRVDEHKVYRTNEWDDWFKKQNG